jgi:ArsR family transcriptional regulator
VQKALLNLKAEALQAMAQPTRLKILECLRGGERCVCEIFPAIDEEQSNVSRHLAVLRKADLVTCWKEGPRMIYKVKNEEVFKIIDGISNIIRAQHKGKEALIKQL